LDAVFVMVPPFRNRRMVRPLIIILLYVAVFVKKKLSIK